MDIKGLLDTLEKGVSFAEQLSPILSAIPGAGPIVGTAIEAAGAITEVVSNVSDRVAEGQIVMNSDDEAQLKALLTRIQGTNDSLADYIDRS